MSLTDLGDGGEVEKGCDLCDFVAVGPAVGPGSAGFKLGTHRYREHGIRSTKRRGAKNVVTDEDIAAHPVVSIVRDAAGQVGGKGAPSAEDLTAGLGRGLGLVSTAVASFAAETDPMIPDGPDGDAARNHLVAYLALSDKAARDTMRPLGKAIAPTTFNRKHGRQLVDNVDVVASVAELVTLSLHWRTYFRQRANFQKMVNQQGAVYHPPAGATVIDLDVPDAPAGPPQAPTSPAPENGVVVDAAMVQQLRQQRGG